MLILSLSHSYSQVTVTHFLALPFGDKRVDFLLLLRLLTERELLLRRIHVRHRIDSRLRKANVVNANEKLLKLTVQFKACHNCIGLCFKSEL